MGWNEYRNAVCRIYRPIRAQDHNLVLREADWSATTDEAIPCRRMDTEEDGLLYAQDLSVLLASLQVPVGTDIERGYAVVLYKLRTVSGAREVVSATLSAAASTGATTLTVSTSTGFLPGDLCVVTGSSTQQALRIKSVTDTTLTLYSDGALEAEYAEDDVVEAKTLWIVRSAVPVQGTHLRQCRIQQQPGFWIS